jgi:hypothetical protein
MAIRMEISDLQDTYVICRTIGHSWDDNPTAEVNSDLFRAAQACLALRCTRCTTERFDYIGNDMKVFQRYYRYPEQYTTISSFGEPMRPKMRAEMINRSLLVRRRTKAKVKVA